MKLPEQDNTFEYKFAKLKHSLKLRVLKIQLSNGDIEYLATNIFDPQITLDVSNGLTINAGALKPSITT